MRCYVRLFRGALQGGHHCHWGRVGAKATDRDNIGMLIRQRMRHIDWCPADESLSSETMCIKCSQSAPCSSFVLLFQTACSGTRSQHKCVVLHDVVSLFYRHFLS